MNEKLTNLFTKYKKAIIVAVSLLVIAVIGISAYSQHLKNQSEKQSLEFKAVLDMLVVGKEEDRTDIEEKLANLQKNGNKGFKTLSYLVEFKNHIEQDNKEKAKATLENALNDGKVPEVYKDMIKYSLSLMLLQEGDINLADTKVDELLNKPKSDYYVPALLLSVSINIKKEDYDKALRNAELIINNRGVNPQMAQLASSLKYYILQKQSEK